MFSIKKNIIIYSLLFGFFFSCHWGQDKKNVDYEKINGNRFYGGVFQLRETEYFHNLFPHGVRNATGHRIANQLYEGLVKLHQSNLSIKPALARSWNIDSTGTIYTFHLREGAKFHKSPCFEHDSQRVITASDFKYSFELLCTQHGQNSAFSQTFKDVVQGATKYYKASTNGPPDFDLTGVQVVDEHTLKIILEEPYSPFLYTLALPYTSVISERAYKKFGHEARVGAGPFRLKRKQQKKLVVLERQAHYYRNDRFGNQLPYLDSIKISFANEQEKVQAFKNQSLDMVSQLSTETIIEILEQKKNAPKHLQYIQQRSPQMSVQYYAFQTKDKLFRKKKVRKAFNFAINRRMIVNKVLRGEAYAPGHFGIIPPTINGYEAFKVEGYQLDTIKAQQLLAEAGYPDGKGFPTVTLDVNTGSGINERVAKEVKQQLDKHLNVRVKLRKMSLNKKVERAKNGKSRFWRSGWLADYPHPQNFLSLFYGKHLPGSLNEPSYPNTTRYNNATFNRLYEQGLSANTKEKSYDYFRQAEQIMMSDAPIIVLWYEESYRILQPYVRNFPNNAMQYRDFTKVWFDFQWEQPPGSS